MKLNFLTMLIAVVVIGLGIGGAFAGGVMVGERRVEPTPAASSLAETLQEQSQKRMAEKGVADPELRTQLQEQLAQGTPLPEKVAPGGFLGGLGSTGVVEKVEGNTVTVSDQRSSTTILVEETTAISLPEEGELGDLKEGDQVMVFGQKNDDGTVSATSIIIVPTAE